MNTLSAFAVLYDRITSFIVSVSRISTLEQTIRSVFAHISSSTIVTLSSSASIFRTASGIRSVRARVKEIYSGTRQCASYVYDRIATTLNTHARLTDTLMVLLSTKSRITGERSLIQAAWAAINTRERIESTAQSLLYRTSTSQMSARGYILGLKPFGLIQKV